MDAGYTSYSVVTGGRDPLANELVDRVSKVDKQIVFVFGQGERYVHGAEARVKRHVIVRMHDNLQITFRAQSTESVRMPVELTWIMEC